MLLAAVALAIAVLPSILYFRDRANSRAQIARLEQTPQMGDIGPAALLYSLKPSGSATDVVRLSSSPQWIVFSLDLDSTAPFGSYRATMTRGDGKQVWQAGHLSPSGGGKLVFVLVSTVLGPDRYTVSLKAQGDAGEQVSASEYAFRAAN
jgi:hypothetical protein